MIMMELQKSFGEIYLGKEIIISTDHFFILENLRINFQMDAGGFEGLLYNILSEEHFAITDLILQMKIMIIPYPIMFSSILAS